MNQRIIWLVLATVMGLTSLAGATSNTLNMTNPQDLANEVYALQLNRTFTFNSIAAISNSLNMQGNFLNFQANEINGITTQNQNAINLVNNENNILNGFIANESLFVTSTKENSDISALNTNISSRFSTQDNRLTILSANVSNQLHNVTLSENALRAYVATIPSIINDSVTARTANLTKTINNDGGTIGLEGIIIIVLFIIVLILAFLIFTHGH